ncbi:MAG: hypothetical protein AB1801_27885 [Chloroflexota bacterium]
MASSAIIVCRPWASHLCAGGKAASHVLEFAGELDGLFSAWSGHGIVLQ